MGLLGVNMKKKYMIEYDIFDEVMKTLIKEDEIKKNVFEGSKKEEGEKKMNCWEKFELSLSCKDIHRILLYGSPGTGKTSNAIRSRKDGKFSSITLHEESCVSELLGHWIKKGDGYEYHYGAAIVPFKEGHLLVLNEIDKVSSSVMTSLHNLLDDKEIAQIHLPNNEVIKCHPNFTVISTMNGLPNDLSDPLLDRFDIIIKIDTPHPQAIEKLSPDLRDFTKRCYSTSDVSISYRSIYNFDKLRKSLKNDETAGDLVFSNDYKEIIATIKLGLREEKK